jgi:hypothetical protein
LLSWMATILPTPSGADPAIPSMEQCVSCMSDQNKICWDKYNACFNQCISQPHNEASMAVCSRDCNAASMRCGVGILSFCRQRRQCL